MKNEIDYKKLELCMIELFGDLNWDMYDEESRYRIRFLTNSGQVISEEFVGSIDLVDEFVRLALGDTIVIRENGNGSGYTAAGHSGCFLWSVALYITRYVSEPEKYVNDIIKTVLGPNGKPYKSGRGFDTEDGRNNLFNITKMCRVNIGEFKHRGLVLQNSSCDLNIESLNSLTSGQRKFFLGVIEGLHINSDRIFIDDYSEEQSIKRQLGIHFFK